MPFTPRALQRREAMLDLGQIEHQVVGPQAGPLADGRRLGRLQVREAQARQVAILLGEIGQRDRSPPTSRPRDQFAAPSRIRIRSVLSVT